MAKQLTLVNGVPRLVDDAAALPPIYDTYILIIEGTASNENEMQGPVNTGTPLTLPGNASYVADELEVYLNGQRIEKIIDYIFLGSESKTQIAFTFDLVPSDRIRFRIDRGA